MRTIRLLAVTAAAVEALRPTLVPRTTRHQAMVTAACAATAGLVAGVAPDIPSRHARWLLPAGVVVGVLRGTAHARAQRRSYPEWDPRPQNPVLASAAGVAAGLTLAAGPGVAYRGVVKAGAALSSRHGGSAAAWSSRVAATVGGGLAGASVIGARSALGALREIGTAADYALRQPPDDPHVTGGPGSPVDYDTLARDGRRFVSLRTPADQIRTVTSTAIEPLRVYVGLQSADTVEARVGIAMAELERLGAFSRRTVLIMSPAGSGYAEYVAAEAVECFTAGDCASVVVQYGVLPSMLSLDRVGLGARTVRALLDRILERVALMDTPPLVIMYGESLGARVAQEALALAPSLESDGIVSGIDALLSVGTPGGPSMRNDLRYNPNVVHLDRWQQLTGQDSAQLWFLDHDADPVTRWDGALAWRYPAWLRRPRGRNIPDGMAWLPVLTWWQVIFDLVFAAQQQSGQFRSRGHDYRADLAPVLAAVLGVRADVPAVAGLLARREVQRDSLLAEQTASSLPH